MGGLKIEGPLYLDSCYKDKYSVIQIHVIPLRGHDSPAWPNSRSTGSSLKLIQSGILSLEILSSGRFSTFITALPWLFQIKKSWKCMPRDMADRKLSATFVLTHVMLSKKTSWMDRWHLCQYSLTPVWWLNRAELKNYDIPVWPRTKKLWYTSTQSKMTPWESCLLIARKLFR